MLVLTRKASQSIRIGQQITVNIVRIRGNTVQLGIDAPRDIHIVRSELLARLDESGTDQTDESSEHAAAGEGATDDEAEDSTFYVQFAPCVSSPQTAADDETRDSPHLLASPLQQFIFSP